MKEYIHQFVYILLVLTLLAPLLTVTDKINLIFFQDVLYSTISRTLFTLIMLLIIVRYNNFKIKLNLLDLWISLYFLYSISILLAQKNKPISNDFFELISIYGFYLILKIYFSISANSKTKQENYFFTSIMIATLIPIGIGVLEFSGVIKMFGSNFIMTGGFLNQGVFANYIATLLPFPIALILIKQQKIIRILSFIIFLISLTVLILTTSRTAWISGLTSLIYLIFYGFNIKSLIVKTLQTTLKKTIVASLVIIFICTGSIFLYNFKKDSANGRLFTWKICLSAIKEKPLFGHGINSFHAAYNSHQINYFKENTEDIKNGMLANEAKYAFNDYLQIAIEKGLIGLFPFLVIVFGIFLIPHKKHYLLIAVKAAVLSTLICSLFSYPLINSIHYTLFFILIAYASSKHNSNQYSFSFLKKRIVTLPISILLACLISLSLSMQISHFYYCNKWKTAYKMVQNKNFNYIPEIYHSLYPHFQNHYLFLFNYGSLLIKEGKSFEGIKILEHAQTINTSYNLFINLGDGYEKIKNYKLAEKYYNKASLLIPHKLTPKYFLLNLYQQTNDLEKAIQTAKAISNMEIKIYTPLAGQIKNDALKFLRKNSSKFEL